MLENYYKFPTHYDTDGGFRTNINGPFLNEIISITVLVETKNMTGNSNNKDRKYAFRTSYFYHQNHSPFIEVQVKGKKIYSKVSNHVRDFFPCD